MKWVQQLRNAGWWTSRVSSQLEHLPFCLTWQRSGTLFRIHCSHRKRICQYHALKREELRSTQREFHSTPPHHWAPHHWGVVKQFLGGWHHAAPQNTHALRPAACATCTDAGELTCALSAADTFHESKRIETNTVETWYGRKNADCELEVFSSRQSLAV